MQRLDPRSGDCVSGSTWVLLVPGPSYPRLPIVKASSVVQPETESVTVGRCAAKLKVLVFGVLENRDGEPKPAGEVCS